MNKRDWTKEMDDFIREHRDDGAHEYVCSILNERFGADWTKDQFIHHVHEIGVKKYAKHTYSSEEDAWLRNNFRKYGMSELTERFNETFRLNISPSVLRNHCRTMLNLVQGSRHKWTEEEDEHLRLLKERGTQYSDMIPMFHEKFGCLLTVDALKVRARKIAAIKEEHCPFNKEQDEWLRKNALVFENYEDCVQAFNKTFGTSKTARGVQSHCVRHLGLVSGRQAFKKGNKPWCTHEALHETKRSIGYTYVKNSNGEWVPKQQYIWEQAHGKLPDGYFVVFLNRDMNDFRLENLAIIDRKKHARMCSAGWYSEEPILTKTAITYCELDQLIRENRRNA